MAGTGILIIIILCYYILLFISNNIGTDISIMAISYYTIGLCRDALTFDFLTANDFVYFIFLFQYHPEI